MHLCSHALQPVATSMVFVLWVVQLFRKDVANIDLAHRTGAPMLLKRRQEHSFWQSNSDLFSSRYYIQGRIQEFSRGRVPNDGLVLECY